MNKKIVFYYQCFGTGGAEICSLKMLDKLKKRGYSIQLIADYPNPAAFEMLKDYPIIYLCNRTYPWGAGILKQLLFLVYSRIIRFIRSRNIYNTHYDTLIIGIQGTPLTYINARKIADRTVQFIHSDIAHMKHAENIIKIIRKNRPFIDYYVCVSNGVYNSFVSLFPECKIKTERIYNILDTDVMKNILQKAVNPYPVTDKPIIVTVARLADNSKALFRMIDVCKELDARGLKFKWYIVGKGPDEDKMKKRIEEYQLDDHMVMVGYRSNPFPYFKYADITAVLSYHEGFCTTVNEAKISGCAVIATEFSAIHEQLENGKNGMIVANDKGSIVEGMAKIIQDSQYRKSISNDYLAAEILDDNIKIQRLIEIL